MSWDTSKKRLAVDNEVFRSSKLAKVDVGDEYKYINFSTLIVKL